MVPTTEPSPNDVSKALGFLGMGFDFLGLVENSLTEVINQGNLHLIISDEPITNDIYFEKTKWSDFRIFIPVLYNFYHAVELIMKGLLVFHQKMVATHKLTDLSDALVEAASYPQSLMDVLNKHLDENKLNTILKSYLATNHLTINELYSSLRYPGDKNINKIYSHIDLKYRGSNALSYYQELIKDIKILRDKAGEYYSQYRHLIV
jgi:hypothetical protein